MVIMDKWLSGELSIDPDKRINGYPKEKVDG
jgi:hypothetical protein